MKLITPEAIAAYRDSAAVIDGALYLATAPTPYAIWGGQAPLFIDGVEFSGIGAHMLCQDSSGALGGSEQNLTVQISGVEPEQMALVNMASLRRAPYVLYRITRDQTGRRLLDAQVYSRGKVDQAPVDETPAGTSTISLMLEGAARGMGRDGGRVASDADQRLIDPADAGLSAISFAAEKKLYWGGKPPGTVSQVLTVKQVSDALWNRRNG